MTIIEKRNNLRESAQNWLNVTGAQAHREYGEIFLGPLKQQRASALNWKNRRPFLMLGGGLMGIIIAVFFAEPIIAIGALLAGIGIGAVIPSLIASHRAADVRSALQDCVAAALNLKNDTSHDVPTAAQRAYDAKLVPGFDRAKYSFRYFGTCDDIDFEICRAYLEEEQTTTMFVNGRMETDTKWVTVFNGLMFSFALRRQLEAPIRLRRDRLLGTFFDGDDRINYVHPEFNDRFTVYCKDPMAAKYIIHPVMVETLIAIDQEFDGNKLIGDFAAQRFTGTLANFSPFDKADIDPDHDVKSMDGILAEWLALRNLMHRISEPE